MHSKEDLILEVENKYMKSLFGFAMNKSHCYEEAEELAAEVTYQLVESIYRVDEVQNLEAFVWGVAKNTYKKWLTKKKRQEREEVLKEDAIEEKVNAIVVMEEKYEENQEVQRLRRELTLLTKEYREVLVAHYMQNSGCREISEKLDMSESMVKFYLSKGREKIKEGLTMERVYGEKSYNPADFAIYLFGEWNGNKDLWEITSRKLVNNILLIAYEKPVTLTELSIETGVPTVFLEEELEMLLEEELMREVTKGKYQTNIFIANENMLSQIRDIIGEELQEVGNEIIEGYHSIVGMLKMEEPFGRRVEEVHYRTFYFQKVLLGMLYEMFMELDYVQNEQYNLNNGYIIGCEENFISCLGMSPIDREHYKGVLCDIMDVDVQRIFLKKQTLCRLTQRQLTKERIQNLIDIRQGKEIEHDKLLYLLENRYISTKEKGFHVNIPILTEDVDDKVNQEIKRTLEKMSLHVHKTTRSMIKRFTRQTPKYLRENLYGYVCALSAAYTCGQYMDYLRVAGFIDFKEVKEKVTTGYLVLKMGEISNE